LVWGVGIGVSLLSNQGMITITTIEACDAILVTAPVYYLLMRYKCNRVLTHHV